MQRARTALILENPFFGVLALKLNMFEDPTIETASVNGVDLKYNPAFTNKLSDDEREGLIAHEVMHCVLQHMTRRQYRDPERFNQACDYSMNGNLEKQGFIMPAGGCINHDWDDFSAEHIYSILQEMQSKGEEPTPGVNFGNVTDALPSDASESEVSAVEATWKINTQQAVSAAKMQGNLPKGMERLLGDILDPIIDWKTMLYKYIHTPVKDDYNWGRPNRRFLHAGIVLPTLYSHAMGDVAVIVDTSGSISQHELDHFSGELSGICEDAKPRTVHIYYCDTKVHRHDTFTVDEYPIKLQACGGGGTDMEPAFAEIEKLDQQPECIVCLTDMYLDTDHINIPDCDTLWISTGRADVNPKFGEVTKLVI